MESTISYARSSPRIRSLPGGVGAGAGITISVAIADREAAHHRGTIERLSKKTEEACGRSRQVVLHTCPMPLITKSTPELEGRRDMRSKLRLSER